jgi:hypothetical protein
MTLGRRLAVCMLLPLALALAASLAVALRVPETLSRQSHEARLVFRLENLRAAIEANLALGLPMGELAVTQDLIERAQRTDEGLLAVEVFAPDEVTLFSTNRGVIGEPVPSAWAEAAAAGGDGPGGSWRRTGEGETLLGLPVRNDLGEVVANVAGVSAAATLGEPAAALRRTLTGTMLLLAPATLAFGTLAAWALARRLSAPAARVVGVLRDGGAAAGPLAGPALAAQQACAAVLNDLDRARADLEAVDHAT